jgi:tRNA modification GTPase
LLDELLRTADEGRLLRRGLRAAIVGRPNAGKSSLLNRLLGHDRAIVSSVPGTTRDTIEETASVRGVPVVFVDTAGVREGTDDIEREGVRRSREMAGRAELILHVVDGSEPPHADDAELFTALAARPRLLVLNKSDLPRRAESLPAPALPVSCATGEGIEALRDAILAAVRGGRGGAEMPEVTINARHQDALRRACESAARARAALAANLTLELAAADLRHATDAVGEVVGRTSTEDLLDSIFSQFCIGK